MAIDTTLPVYAFAPEWSDIVRERIEFLTDAIPATNGSVQTRSVRLTPRRSFEFMAAEVGLARQWMTNMAWGSSARQLYLPLWTESRTLGVTLDSASEAIPVAVAGYDFAAGQVIMLRGPKPHQVELVQVDAIEADQVTLATPTVQAWGAGTAVLPVRRARLDADFSVTAFNRSMTYGRVRFLIDEPNPWAATAPAPIYRGFPVVTVRPAWSQDPETSLDRQLELVDDSVGLIAVHDPVGMPLYRQEHDWNLDGRAQLASFRDLVYSIRGKRNSVWLPSWLDDLTPTASITATGTGLACAWSGYTDHIDLASNRRDVRIELTNGAVLYRRIVSTTVVDANTELLVLDSNLGQGRTVTAAEFAQVSFLGLCRSDSDIFELGWWTGEYADVSTAWRARQHDL